MFKHNCPDCGRGVGFPGLCWNCKHANERAETFALSDEEVLARKQYLVANISKIIDWQYEYTSFWNLLSYRGASMQEVACAAFNKGIYFPEEIYYRATEEVRNLIIKKLNITQDSCAAHHLLICLAMQGDDVALEALSNLEENPRPWRESLQVDPSVYAQSAGWTFDKNKNRIPLTFDTCYPMVKGDPKTQAAASIATPREDDKCEVCGCTMVDILTIDGRDERLSFLHIDGKIKATCCPNCVARDTLYCDYTLDGDSKVLPREAKARENNMDEEALEELLQNEFVLADESVPMFYGSAHSNVNTIGGFPSWIQDSEYKDCPHCQKKMKYVAQIQVETILSTSEGTVYVEICEDCHTLAMFHQQT